jgi:hypothetical protein
MARLLPLVLAVACVAASAQDDTSLDTPVRDAHVVTVYQADGGGYEFEVEDQDRDFEALLTPGGVLVVAATDGLQILVVTERAYYIDNDYPNDRPLLVGPEMLRIDGRDRDRVGVLRVVPEIPRGESGHFTVEFLVCTAEFEGSFGGACSRWEPARPSRRMFTTDGEPTGLDAGLHVRVVGHPIVLSPDPPVRPVRD